MNNNCNNDFARHYLQRCLLFGVVVFSFLLLDVDLAAKSLSLEKIEFYSISMIDAETHFDNNAKTLIAFQEPRGTTDEGEVDDDGGSSGTILEKCDGKDNDGDGEIDEGFLDSDFDGTADCVDLCPLDASKTKPGYCGCGKIEDRWDSDYDGVIDCLDACPMNPYKSRNAGICGCDYDPYQEYQDTDGDGVLNCQDACPYNFYESTDTHCGCEAPPILDVVVDNISACNSLNNTFTADIKVYFAYPPELGGINFRGDIEFYHNFENNNKHNVIYFSSSTFIAHGGILDFIIEYKGNEGCSYHFEYGPSSPIPCNHEDKKNTGNPIPIADDKTPIPIAYVTPSCGIDYISIENIQSCNDNRTRFKTADDFLQTDITIKYTHAPSEGMLKLTGAASVWVDVAQLAGKTAHTIRGIKLPADGKPFDLGAIFTHGNQCAYLQRFEGMSLKGEHKCQSCNVMNVSLMSMQCTEETIIFDLMVTGGHTASYYTLNGATSNYTGTYNQISTFTCPAKGSLVMEVIDDYDSSCSYLFELSPNACGAGGRNNANPSSLALNNILNYSPNPAQDELLIEFNIPAKRKITDSKITIYDMLGKKYLERKVIAHQAKMYVDISELQNGLYLMTLDMNGLLYTGKLVKESWK